MGQYKSAYSTQNTDQVVSRAMIKYGIENFTYEHIASCQTLEDVNETEIELIKQYNSRDPNIGYNIDMGGNTLSKDPIIRERISAGLQEYYKDHDGWAKGKTFSEEHKKKISESSMGNPGTNTGKIFDDEWRKNMSEAHLGKTLSEETRKKIIRKSYGTHCS